MEPILIGAAVGAGTSAVFGGDPLKGALLGGATGGLGGALKGGVGNLINGIGTNALAGGNVAKGLAINASLLGGAQGFGVPAAAASSAAPAAAASAPASLLSQSIANVAPIGFKAPLDLGISAVTPASLVDDAILSTAQPMNATAAAMGGGFKLPANAAEIVGQNPSILDNLREYMPSGRDLAGLGLQSAMQPRPTVQAPAGGITQGRATDIAAVQNLVSSMRRKPPEGILGDYFG
jgi:hypothetical protein